MPTPKPVQSVAFRKYDGDRKMILEQIAAGDLPPQWGSREVITAYILDQMPGGSTWRGTLTITGYRTPVNDKGTGTAYVSVNWAPTHRP